jgi:hypothetical protein
MVVRVVESIPSPDPALGGSVGVVCGQHSMVITSAVTGLRQHSENRGC